MKSTISGFEAEILELRSLDIKIVFSCSKFFFNRSTMLRIFLFCGRFLEHRFLLLIVCSTTRGRFAYKKKCLEQNIYFFLLSTVEILPKTRVRNCMAKCPQILHNIISFCTICTEVASSSEDFIHFCVQQSMKDCNKLCIFVL